MGKESWDRIWGAIWQHMETTEKALRTHIGNTQEPPRGSQETPRGNQRHPGEAQEKLSRHSGATKETPGSTQEAPRRHPGGTQEDPRDIQNSSRRHPSAVQGRTWCGVFGILFKCIYPFPGEHLFYQLTPMVCVMHFPPLAPHSGKHVRF